MGDHQRERSRSPDRGDAPTGGGDPVPDPANAYNGSGGGGGGDHGGGGGGGDEEGVKLYVGNLDYGTSALTKP